MRSSLLPGFAAVVTPCVALAADLPDVNVKVHLEADDPRVRLYRAGANPHLLCGAPCDLDLSVRPDDEFWFGGDGITQSAPFVFAQPGDVNMRVHAGNDAANDGATGLKILGGIGMVTGPLLLLSGGVTSICIGDDQAVCAADRAHGQTIATVGLVTLAAGLSAFIAGTVMSHSSATTWQSHRDSAPRRLQEVAPQQLRVQPDAVVVSAPDAVQDSRESMNISCPPPLVPVVLERRGELHAAPDGTSRLITTLKSQMPGCAAPDEQGFEYRRVRLQDGIEGFIAESDLAGTEVPARSSDVTRQ